MGILNYTPDSFSDGGLYNTPVKALERAVFLEKSGADIIDIGAASTRPGSTPLTPDEECSRLSEVLGAVTGKIRVPVSVDTFYPECAELALRSGASLINDVSGTFNREIAKLVMQYDGCYIITHNPCGADKAESYPFGVIPAIRNFFVDCLGLAAESGFPKDRIIFDPGFGFGKTNEDNIELLENLQWLKFKNIPLLAALSRKRFLSALYPGETDKDKATAAANDTAVRNGADIIRIHKL